MIRHQCPLRMQWEDIWSREELVMVEVSREVITEEEEEEEMEGHSSLTAA